MTMTEFIRVYRAEIDDAIRLACPNIGSLNNGERSLWILNNEDLYLWAKDCGVRL